MKISVFNYPFGTTEQYCIDSKPRMGKGDISCIVKIESFKALKSFTFDITHLPGDATSLSINLGKEYSKSNAFTFLPFKELNLSVL